MTSHYIALQALSRACGLLFWSLWTQASAGQLEPERERLYFSKNAFSKNAFSKNAFSKNAFFENAFSSSSAGTQSSTLLSMRPRRRVRGSCPERRRPSLGLEQARDLVQAATSESVGWQNFGKMLLVFGCIGSDFCKKIRVVQYFSKSTRFSS